MMHSKLVVGIDAGGTKTELVLCNGMGEVLGRVFRGTGNPNDIGIDNCVALLTDGIRELCKDSSPDAIFAGISGAGSGNNSVEIRKALESAFPNSAMAVSTDASNLLASGKSCGDSAALICGTGTALFVQREGVEYRIGGWGYLFDRGGSAYDLGRDAIRAALAAEEKLIPEGELYRRVKAELGEGAHSALAEIYRQGKAYIASFARIAVECAERGDEVAVRIVNDSISALSNRTEAAIKLYGDIPELICGGGLFNSEYFSSLLANSVRKYGVELYIPSLPQSFGACVRAVGLIGEIDKAKFAESFAATLKKLDI